jgi:hypothetical protein
MKPTFSFDEDSYLGGGGEEYHQPEWTNQPWTNPEDAICDYNASPHPPEEPEQKEEPEYFEPRPLKSRRLELEALGEAGSRSQCFGCVYFGEKETTIPSDEIYKLIEMSRQSIGRIDMICLAQGMEDYYEKHIRQKVNARLLPGERPLPPWRAAQILEHIRHHNQDPLIQQVVLLAETQELRAALLDCCFEVSSKTGKVRPNKHNIESYDRIVKLQLHIQGKDASKMAFASAGAKVNPEILSQGLLSTHTKQLHNFWKT